MTEQKQLISLRLERPSHPNQQLQRHIIYKGEKLQFTDEEYDDFLSKIPSFWNTEKDRLIYYIVYYTGDILCVRNKDVYNFSIKDTEEKTYNFNAFTIEQSNELTQLITDYFTKSKLKQVENAYDNIMEKLYDISYMKYNLLDMRTKSLEQSDFMFNRDYVFKTPESEEQWKKYRQDWRDITETEAWKNNDFLNISIPISPNPIDQYALMKESILFSLQTLSTLDSLKTEVEEKFNSGFDILFQNFTQISLKLEILKAITKMNIPMGMNSEELYTIESILPDNLFLAKDIEDIQAEQERLGNSFDAYTYIIEEKIKIINQKLREYNFDFTISDIIESYLENMRKKSIEIDKDAEAHELLAEIELEGTNGV